MEKKLKAFLDDAFRPYGNFPARKDVEQELLANLLEKYKDLKASGKTEDEAYRATIDSFGEVSEIMEQVQQAPQQEQVEEPSIRQSLKEALRLAKQSRSKFSSSELKHSDLSETDLTAADFSHSSLADTDFDK